MNDPRPSVRPVSGTGSPSIQRAIFLRIAPKRAVIALGVFDLFVLFYYCVGSVQEFLADTQFMLLAILEIVSSALVITGLVGLCMTLLDIPPRTRKLLTVMGYAAAVIAAMIIMTAALLVRAVSGGA